MAHWFDARLTPDGWRFRQWSSVVDCYVSGPLTETEFVAEMRRDYTPREVEYGIPDLDIPKRIARAKQNGTTVIGEGRQDVNGPWETERCAWCGRFHHAFSLRPADGLCQWCGEFEADTAHEKPCEAG